MLRHVGDRPDPGPDRPRAVPGHVAILSSRRIAPWVPSSCVSSSASRHPVHVDRVARHARVLVGGPPLVDRADRVRLGVRGAGRVRRAARAHGGARHALGRPAHRQLRAQGRLPAGRRGLPVGGAARADGAVAVPAVQPVLHLGLPERAHPPVLPARRHRSKRPTPLGAWDVVLAVVFLAFLAGETVADQQQWNVPRWKARRARGGAHPEPGFLQTGLFRVLAAPELLLRAGPVVGVLRLRRGRDGRLAALDDAGAVLLTLLFIGSTASPSRSRDRSTPATTTTGAHLGARAVVSAIAAPPATTA